MNILTIGDLHGLDCWKTVDPSKYDKIIFLGDYVDSFTIKCEDILKNLNEVIEFKKTYPDKVELLLGNHDTQYMLIEVYGQCSGFQRGYYPVYHHTFISNKDLFKVSYQYLDHVWSHAGITNKWILENSDFLHHEIFGYNVTEGERLNMLIKTGRGIDTLHQVGPERNGNDSCSGPLWCHSDNLIEDHISGFTQIVGHSRLIAGKKIEGIVQFEDLVFCDCLENQAKEGKDFTFFDLTI